MEQTVPAPLHKPPREEGAFARAWRTFVSVKVGLFILLVIAALSFIGMLVPQGGQPSQYVEKYGPGIAAILLATGLDDAYHALWYQLALLVLALQITACTVWRMPRAIRQALGREWVTEPAAAKGVDCRRVFAVDGDAASAAARAGDALRRRGYSVREKAGPSGPVLSATRGGISRLGAPVVHIGLVVTLIGGVYGGRAGWSKIVYGAPGEIVHSPDGAFDVRVDDFKILLNPDGSVKDYVSSLTVLEDGREAAHQEIEVNKLLRHRGVNIYQSSYSLLPEQVASATLRVKWPDGSLSDAVKVSLDEAAPVPGTQATVLVDAFVADFRMDTRTREVFSASDQPRNPAVRVTLTGDGAGLGAQWAFLHHEGMHGESGAPQVQFVDFEAAYATGLDFAHNPALPIVWAGFFLMSLGVVPMLLLMTHRRVWVVLTPDGPRSRVAALGAASKHRESFTKEFHALMDLVEKGKESGLHVRN
jgi:cytochrome c biogenesis protein